MVKQNLLNLHTHKYFSFFHTEYLFFWSIYAIKSLSELWNQVERCFDRISQNISGNKYFLKDLFNP